MRCLRRGSYSGRIVTSLTSIILGNRFLCSFSFERELSPHEEMFGEGGRSFAYFCTGCGEIWARVVVEGSPFHDYVISRPCERHADRWRASGRWSGSLLNHTFTERCLAQAPREFWEWEGKAALELVVQPKSKE